MKKLLSLFAVVLFTGSMFATDMTCADAAEAAKGGSTAEVTVQGYVTVIQEAWNSQYNNVTFWMADTKDGGKVFEVFRAVCESAEAAPKVGDLVKATGKLKLYNSTPELDKGCTFEILERAPEVKLDTIGVSEALQRITDNKLGACYVKGKVTRIETKGDAVANYGNLNIWLRDLENANDSIKGYKIYGANNQKYKSAADVEYVEGDDILVYANELKMYNTTPEINVGYYVRTLNGKEIVALEWANPDASATHDGANWTMKIKKSSSDADNVLEFVFPSDKADAIAGSYTLSSSSLKLDGASVAIVSATAMIKFKSIGSNSNIYNVQVSVIGNEKIYRLVAEMDIYAENENGETRLKGDRPFVPAEGDTITCAQAREYVLSLDDKVDGMTIIVRGFVTEIINTEKVYKTFWMDDEKGTNKTFEVAFYKELLPAGFELELGTEVIAVGVAYNYGGTPEVKNASVTIVGAEVNTYEATVDEALKVGKALAQNETTKDLYKITGFITNVSTAYDEQYGNISFWMSDTEGDGAQEFQAYRAKCDASIVDKLVEGAKVIVTANIQNFHQDAKPAEGDQDAKPERNIIQAVNGTVELFSTPVDNVFNNAPAVKFIENGQIYILRNGVRYNVQGQIAQ